MLRPHVLDVLPGGADPAGCDRKGMAQGTFAHFPRTSPNEVSLLRHLGPSIVDPTASANLVQAPQNPKQRRIPRSRNTHFDPIGARWVSTGDFSTNPQLSTAACAQPRMDKFLSDMFRAPTSAPRSRYRDRSADSPWQTRRIAWRARSLLLRDSAGIPDGRGLRCSLQRKIEDCGR